MFDVWYSILADEFTMAEWHVCRVRRLYIYLVWCLIQYSGRWVHYGWVVRVPGSEIIYLSCFMFDVWYSILADEFTMAEWHVCRVRRLYIYLVWCLIQYSGRWVHYGWVARVPGSEIIYLSCSMFDTVFWQMSSLWLSGTCAGFGDYIFILFYVWYSILADEFTMVEWHVCRVRRLYIYLVLCLMFDTVFWQMSSLWLSGTCAGFGDYIFILFYVWCLIQYSGRWVHYGWVARVPGSEIIYLSCLMSYSILADEFTMAEWYVCRVRLYIYLVWCLIQYSGRWVHYGWVARVPGSEIIYLSCLMFDTVFWQMSSLWLSGTCAGFGDYIFILFYVWCLIQYSGRWVHYGWVARVPGSEIIYLSCSDVWYSILADEFTMAEWYVCRVRRLYIYLVWCLIQYSGRWVHYGWVVRVPGSEIIYLSCSLFDTVFWQMSSLWLSGTCAGFGDYIFILFYVWCLIQYSGRWVHYGWVARVPGSEIIYLSCLMFDTVFWQMSSLWLSGTCAGFGDYIFILFWCLIQYSGRWVHYGWVVRVPGSEIIYLSCLMFDTVFWQMSSLWLSGTCAGFGDYIFILFDVWYSILADEFTMAEWYVCRVRRLYIYLVLCLMFDTVFWQMSSLWLSGTCAGFGDYIFILFDVLQYSGRWVHYGWVVRVPGSEIIYLSCFMFDVWYSILADEFTMAEWYVCRVRRLLATHDTDHEAYGVHKLGGGGPVLL